MGTETPTLRHTHTHRERQRQGQHTSGALRRSILIRICTHIDSWRQKRTHRCHPVMSCKLRSVYFFLSVGGVHLLCSLTCTQECLVLCVAGEENTPARCVGGACTGCISRCSDAFAARVCLKHYPVLCPINMARCWIRVACAWIMIPKCEWLTMITWRVVIIISCCTINRNLNYGVCVCVCVCVSVLRVGGDHEWRVLRPRSSHSPNRTPRQTSREDTQKYCV